MDTNDPTNSYYFDVNYYLYAINFTRLPFSIRLFLLLLLNSKMNFFPKWSGIEKVEKEEIECTFDVSANVINEID